MDIWVGLGIGVFGYFGKGAKGPVAERKLPHRW